jgi:hypothetical protein
MRNDNAAETADVDMCVAGTTVARHEIFSLLARAIA